MFFVGNKLAPVLIERKSIEDVASSLHDGEYLVHNSYLQSIVWGSLTFPCFGQQDDGRDSREICGKIVTFSRFVRFQAHLIMPLFSFF